MHVHLKHGSCALGGKYKKHEETCYDNERGRQEVCMRWRRNKLNSFAAPSKDQVNVSEFPGAMPFLQYGVISPQQVHMTCRLSRGTTEVCL